MFGSFSVGGGIRMVHCTKNLGNPISLNAIYGEYCRIMTSRPVQIEIHDIISAVARLRRWLIRNHIAQRRGTHVAQNQDQTTRGQYWNTL